MRSRTTALALLVVLAVDAAPAWACEPARAARGVDLLPEAWRNAITDLVGATAHEGEPWGCHGGSIDLTLRDEGATLTVADAEGRTISRPVEAPEEILPLGEALLSKPLPARAIVDPTPVAAPTPAAPGPDRSAKPGKPPPVRKPFLLVGASLAPRIAGRSDIVWGGVEGAVTVPFGPWGAGGWVRYDGPSASLDGHEMHINEVVVGGTILRSFALDPVELRAAFRPAVAIVTQSFGRDREDAVRVSPRLGLQATAVVPVSSPVRGFVTFDTELSPRELGESGHPPSQPPQDGQRSMPQPSFPTYTLGLGLGVEVAIR